MAAHIEIAEESTPKRTFVWAVDWPGWCRSGKDPILAREAFLEAAARYADVAALAGEPFPPGEAASFELDLMESVEGGGGTEFGVPSSITPLDGTPVTAEEADRLARLVEAAWTVFDRVAAAAPAELRKGPRGGGRDRDKMIRHVDEADHAYAGVLGLKLPPPDRADPATVTELRTAMLAILRAPSDGSPIADRKWPPRYAARRIAWHALDHAWEMQDRSEPAA
jgi:hypothetical protein